MSSDNPLKKNVYGENGKRKLGEKTTLNKVEITKVATLSVRAVGIYNQGIVFALFPFILTKFKIFKTSKLQR